MAIVKTRFSPSPTGKLHIGGLRTALYNYLYAKKTGGTFLLRLEDTDQSRKVAGAVENIFDCLAWAGLLHEGTPLVQSQRLSIYQKYADHLLEQGSAYRCFCSQARLELLRREQEAKKIAIRYDGHCRKLTEEEIQQLVAAKTPYVIRFAIPAQGNISCQDLVRGTITFNFATLDDQIIIKSDNFPTYHLASVVDDHETEITHVIRGEEWIPSLPKHILLYQALGWQPPAFAHLPLLLNPDRSKLSKREGDVSVDEYRQAGYLPEALLNFVALLGWNPGTEQEIFSLPELIEQFSFDRVNKSGAVFNREKLDWINGWYLRHLGIERLAELAAPYLRSAGWTPEIFKEDYINQVLAIEQNRIKRLGELPQLVDYFFREPQYETTLLLWRQQTAGQASVILRALRDYLASLPTTDFTASALEKDLKDFISQHGWGNGEVLWPLRVALSGRSASPSPYEIASILGKDKVLDRVDQGINQLANP